MDSNNSDSYVSHKATVMQEHHVNSVPSERPTQVTSEAGWSVTIGMSLLDCKWVHRTQSRA